MEYKRSMSLVVHCKRSPYDIYIGRPSIWGNPFEIGRDGTRAQVIEKYRDWLLRQPHLVAKLPELRGKTLGCWCAPKDCHGRVLVELSLGPTFAAQSVLFLNDLDLS